EENAVASPVIESHLAIDHAGDERRLLEYRRVASGRVDHAGATERLAEVARDVPSLGSVEGLLQFVDDILLVFQIRVPKHRVHDEEAVHLARADKWVAVVRPRFGAF